MIDFYIRYCETIFALFREGPYWMTFNEINTILFNPIFSGYPRGPV